MSIRLLGPFGLWALTLAGLSASADAQNPFATSVVDYQQGSGTGLFDPAAILGGPRGLGLSSGSLDVLSLGSAGQVTLGFDVTITDGPGVDLVAFENGFELSGGVFAEVAFVEVSTNGLDFARLPSRYRGEVGPLPAFGNVPYGTYSGLVGGVPVRANVDTNTIDPLDPVGAGGEAFDLADLAPHPLVLAGAVDLNEIHFVRLVDAVAGVDTDSESLLVWDNGGAASSADIDAVAVIQHTGNQSSFGPRVELFLGVDGHLNLVISEPDGLADLDLSTLSASFNLRAMSFDDLRRFFRGSSSGSGPQPALLQRNAAGTLHLVSNFRMPLGPKGVLAVSVRDRSGAFSADQISL